MTPNVSYSSSLSLNGSRSLKHSHSFDFGLNLVPTPINPILDVNPKPELNLINYLIVKT